MTDENHRRFYAGKYGDEKKEKEKEPDAPDRPVDIFAGKESLADKLRKRRKAIESGDETGGRGYE